MIPPENSRGTLLNPRGTSKHCDAQRHDHCPWRVVRAVVALCSTAIAQSSDVGPTIAPPAPARGVVSSGRWLTVWAQYPPETIRAEDKLATEPRLDTLRITAARGEKEPFLLVARGEVAMSGVGPVIGELKGDAGQVIPASRISVRRIAYVAVDTASGKGVQTPGSFVGRIGDCPDILTTDSRGFLRPDRNLAFWVTVDVPPETRPGIYRGELSMDFRTQEWIRKASPTPRLPIEVRVHRFSLPQPSPLRNITHMAVEKLPDGWLTPDGVRGLCELAAEVRSAPDPLIPAPALQVLEGGEIKLDASAWEEMAAHCLDRLHAPALLLPVWPLWSERKKTQGPLQGLYFLWHFPAVAKQRWPAASPVFIADEAGHLRPEFKKAFGAYLRQMNEIVRRHGWTGRVFVTTMDEPYTYHTEGEPRKLDTPANNYRVIGEFCDLVRASAPELRTFVTADPTPELVGKIDHWCLRTFDDMGRIRDRVASGDFVTFIDNYRAIIDYPVVSSRTYGWLAWSTGASGWVNSETLAAIDRAWEGAVFAAPTPQAPIWWGAMTLFYPDPLTHDFLPSVRWEMMREGCEDYEYLWLLKQATTTLVAGSPREKSARELLAAADAIARPPPHSDSEKTEKPSPVNAPSNTAVWELRCRIAEFLESLN
ncbi:MAG TPA: DUF4091 domain-containing protein [Verrucomicrobiae bacterium]|nr:DUF4091 domain-containing protein [Verrucomicrobiae bacterium]